MNHRMKTTRRWSDLADRYEFRIDRANEIKAAETPVNLLAGARQILHMLPVSACEGGEGDLNLSAVYDGRDWATLLGLGSSSRRYNIDGLCVFSPGDDKEQDAYAQLHRNGVVEAVLAHQSDKARLPSSTVEEFMIDAVESSLRIYGTLGVAAPVLVMLTFIGVKGWQMSGVDIRLGRPDHHQIDRDLVLVPEIRIDAFDEDVPGMLRPALNAAWNAAGWPRSPNYDEPGSWTRPR